MAACAAFARPWTSPAKAGRAVLRRNGREWSGRLFDDRGDPVSVTISDRKRSEVERLLGSLLRDGWQRRWTVGDDWTCEGGG